ncbi:MAG TPA: hypothetical protein VF645_05750 [Allosphingosinicella sp.]|jgi:hypothetical protein
MEMYILRGTPAEILEVQKGLAFADGVKPEAAIGESGAPTGSPSSASGAHQWCSTDVAYRMLTRISLSVEQHLVLKRLYKAGDAWTSATDLQTAINYSTGQFAGLMGAFGRRFTHTEGFVSGTWFFDQEWDHELACNRYRLPKAVREAMEKAKLN